MYSFLLLCSVFTETAQRVFLVKDIPSPVSLFVAKEPSAEIQRISKTGKTSASAPTAQKTTSR